MEMDAVSAYPKEFLKPASSITINSIDPTQDSYDLYEVCKHIEEMYKSFLEVRDFLHEMVTDGREDLLTLGRVMRLGEEMMSDGKAESQNSPRARRPKGGSTF